MTRPAKRPRKRAKTSPAPKSAAPKKTGIIATVTAMMSRPKGATIEEMVAELAKKFPERKAEGMQNTVRVQTSRQKAKRDAEGRYKLAARS